MFDVRQRPRLTAAAGAGAAQRQLDVVEAAQAGAVPDAHQRDAEPLAARVERRLHRAAQLAGRLVQHCNTRARRGRSGRAVEPQGTAQVEPQHMAQVEP